MLSLNHNNGCGIVGGHQCQWQYLSSVLHIVLHATKTSVHVRVRTITDMYNMSAPAQQRNVVLRTKMNSRSEQCTCILPCLFPHSYDLDGQYHTVLSFFDLFRAEIKVLMLAI